MSWISGSCDEPEEERNVVPPGDDEEIDGSSVNEGEPTSRLDDSEIAEQGTHFASNFGHWPRKTW